MEYALRAELYRQQAADCRKQAAAAVTPQSVRDHWLRLAEQYEELADQALKLSTARNQ
jgi:hypothetical protein